MSVRAEVIEALVAAIRAVTAAPVHRNEALPRGVPAGGLVVVRDGDPGEPDVTLNPVVYAYRHGVELEAFVPVAAGTGSDAALDALLDTIMGALAGDRDLGGRVENMTITAPEVSAIVIEGAVPLLAARSVVTVEYLVADPLASD